MKARHQKPDRTALSKVYVCYICASSLPTSITHQWSSRFHIKKKRMSAAIALAIPNTIHSPNCPPRAKSSCIQSKAEKSRMHLSSRLRGWDFIAFSNPESWTLYSWPDLLHLSQKRHQQRGQWFTSQKLEIYWPYGYDPCREFWGNALKL